MTRYGLMGCFFNEAFTGGALVVALIVLFNGEVTDSLLIDELTTSLLGRPRALPIDRPTTFPISRPPVFPTGRRGVLKTVVWGSLYQGLSASSNTQVPMTGNKSLPDDGDRREFYPQFP